MSEGRAALLVLAASGLLWFIAALRTGSATEWLYCGAVLVGFATAATAEIAQKSAGVAVGVAMAAAGNLAPVVVYSAEFGLWAVPWMCIAAGLVVGAVSAARRAGWGRWGMLVSAVGALWILLAFDLSVKPSIWTPGNALLVIGTAMATWRFPRIATTS